MKRKIVKLAPQVPSWCDINNNIYLSTNGNREKELKEDCDMRFINKGVKAGLIIVEIRDDEDAPNTPGIPVIPEEDDDDCDCPRVPGAIPIFCRSSEEVEEIVEDEEEE